MAPKASNRASPGSPAAKRSASPKAKWIPSQKRGGSSNRSSSPGRPDNEAAPSASKTGPQVPDEPNAKTTTTSATAVNAIEERVIPVDVYVCIGSSTSGVAEAEAKVLTDKNALRDWTEQTVTLNSSYAFFNSCAEYAFPRKVFGPEVQRGDMFDTILSRAIESFTRRGGSTTGYNSMFLVYGHIGTLKKQILFGTAASLTSSSFNPEWGVLPRVCESVFRIQQELVDQTSFLLTASVVEFRRNRCFDLLGDHVECTIDNEHMPVGNRLVILNSIEDVRTLYSQVEPKYSCSLEADDHLRDDDSTGHAHVAFVLSLLQMDYASGLYTKTSFSLLDLACAGRPSKTDQQHLDFLSAIMELNLFNGLPDDSSPGSVVDYELQKLRNSCAQASKTYASSGGCARYSPDGSNTVIKFVGGSLTGKSFLNMVLTLSETGQHGWDTWFSLQCAADFARLHVPVCSVKVQHFRKVFKRTYQALQKSKSVLASKSALIYKAQVAYLEQFLNHLDELNGRNRAFSALWEQRNKHRSLAAGAAVPLPTEQLPVESAGAHLLADEVGGKTNVLQSDKASNRTQSSLPVVGSNHDALEPEIAESQEKTFACKDIDAKRAKAEMTSQGLTTEAHPSPFSSSAVENSSVAHLRGLSQCAGCKAPFVDSEEVFASTKNDQFFCRVCREVAHDSIPAKSNGSAAATRPKQCSICSSSFDVNDAIFTSSDTGIYLCKSCVEEQNNKGSICTVCNAAPTEDSSLYEHPDGSGDCLCKDCWNSQALPLCAACQMPPTGSYVQVGDDIYHAECLKCSMCSESIKGSCSRTPLGLACTRCCQNVVAKMEKIAEMLQSGDRAAATKIADELRTIGLDIPHIEPLPNCAACGKPIGSSHSKIGDDIYHPDCLKCAMCSISIQGQFAKTPVGLTCKACCDSIGARMQQVREKLANGDTAGAAGIAETLKAQGIDVPSVHDIEPTVGKNNALPECEVCGKPATASSGMIAGKCYHSECLKCFACSNPIKPTDKFAQTPSGFTCAACCESIKDRLQQMNDLLQNKDLAGAGKIADSLKAQGVEIPPLKVPKL